MRGRRRGSCGASSRVSTKLRADDVAVLKEIAAERGSYVYDIVHEIVAKLTGGTEPEPRGRDDARQMKFDF